MKLLKYIKASTIVLLMATSAQATINYNRCDFKYEIENVFSVCSEKQLSNTQQATLYKQYSKAQRLFPKFIGAHGYKWDDITIPLSIYVMPKSRLNDRTLFSRPPYQALLGRYKDWEGKLYTSYDAVMASNTDFVHELAHYFNNNIPVIDDNENEKLAELFERYYLEHS